MAIQFAGKSVPGTHGIAQLGPQELTRMSTNFWALHGECEIIGGRRGREIVIEMWVHNKYASAANLEATLRNIELELGWHGTLEVTGTNPQIFDQCTFTQLERVPFEGRADAAPLDDVAGTVDGGWVQPIKLHFRQLVVL